MKAKLLIGLAALQALVLAYMAGEREWVLRTGRMIYLRTAPLDPRDAMRGDYVRLNYQISRVPRSFWRGDLASTNEAKAALPADTKVYAALHLDEENFAGLVSLSTERPADGLLLRGRTERNWGGDLQVRYGLEAYFMEQGKGLLLERDGSRDGVQVPLEMKVAVSPGGLAVLKDHRWCALGIGMDIEMATNTVTAGRREPQRRAMTAKVCLLNASSNDVAIVDRPGGRSLALVPNAQWGENPWCWAREEEALPAPEAGQVIVLKPGQVHVIRVALDDAAWSVVEQGKAGRGSPVKLTELPMDRSASFRLEYRAPSRAAAATLPNAALIWHGRLPTRAFNAFGGVD